MAIKRNFKISKGALIVEVLIAIFIIIVVFTSLFELVNLSLQTSITTKKTIQANHIAQETMEAVRNFRDNTTWNTDGLGTLSTGISYFPQKTSDNPPKWSLVVGEENINGFVRKVFFEKVYRNGNGNIAETGTEDTNTKKVVVNISWQERGKTYQIELITYLTNWRE